MAKDRKPISARVRYDVLRRDDYTCQACGSKAPNVTLQVDHIKALAKGGSDSIENLRAVCVTCNLGKSDGEVEVAKVATTLEPTKHPLGGWGVLTYNFDDGKEVVSWQGEIRHVVSTNSSQGDVAIIDWFDWMVGDYTYSSSVPLSRLATPYGSNGFMKLFPNSKDRNEYYNYKHGRG